MLSRLSSSMRRGAFDRFPTMTTTQEVVVRKNLKIKYATRRIEGSGERITSLKENHPKLKPFTEKRGFPGVVEDQAEKRQKIERNGEPLIRSCGFRQHTLLIDECATPVKENDASWIFKPDNRSNAEKFVAVGHLKIKSSVSGINKCATTGVIDSQKQRRKKMDRSVTHQCWSILKTLMTHRDGWVFNQPVDPIILNIPDYFSIISDPMDLGTIKSKLEKKAYFSAQEFASDVRLTFSNAMLYNPPANDVHLMAKELNNLFNTRWKSLEEKWNCERSEVDHERNSRGTVNTGDAKQNPQKQPLLRTASLSKRSMSSAEKSISSAEKSISSVEKSMSSVDKSMSSAEKQNLKKEPLEVSRRKMAEGELNKTAHNCGGKPSGRNIQKGTENGNRHANGPVNTKPPSSQVLCKCGSCGNTMCQCRLLSDSSRASSSDIYCERSLSGGYRAPDCGHAFKPDCQARNTPTSQLSKSHLNSVGGVSAVDDNSHLMTPATAFAPAAPEEGLKPSLFGIQLSPKKALRAAQLKSRFADTIFKAQRKTLLDNGDKDDPMRLQREKEKLERMQREEAARIEAQIKAAETASRMKAETELKLQRGRAREAARIALDEMERSVEIDENLKILRELEKLSGCSPLGLFLVIHNDTKTGYEGAMGGYTNGGFRSPLQRLGLCMKDYYLEDEDEEAFLNGDENGDREEGEIL